MTDKLKPEQGGPTPPFKRKLTPEQGGATPAPRNLEREDGRDDDQQDGAVAVTDPNDRENVSTSPMVSESPRHTLSSTEPATLDNKVGAP